MGSETSTPFDETILSPLATQNVEGNKEFFDALFSFKGNGIPRATVIKTVEQYYEKNPNNFIASIKEGSARLETAKEGETGTLLIQVLVMILAIVVKAPNSYNKLSAPDGESTIGELLFQRTCKFFKAWKTFDEGFEFTSECLLLLARCGFGSASYFTDFEQKIKDLFAYQNSRVGKTKHQLLSKTAATIYLTSGLLGVSIKDEECFAPIFTDVNRYNGLEELYTYVLPLILVLHDRFEKISKEKPYPFISNLLYTVDVFGKKQVAFSAMYALSEFVATPDAALAMNIPCASFDSAWPVHRGSYGDLLIELTSRYALLEPTLMHTAVDCISAIIPYVTNLSYVSAVSLMKILMKGIEKKDKYTTNAMIKALNYTINRSIRENIPLVIVVLKNSKPILSFARQNPGFEELKSLVTFLKNVNQELKQVGNSFNSATLEQFFKNPAREYFANPELKPPKVEYVSEESYNKALTLSVDSYISKRIIGVHQILSILPVEEKEEEPKEEEKKEEPKEEEKKEEIKEEEKVESEEKPVEEKEEQKEEKPEEVKEEKKEEVKEEKPAEEEEKKEEKTVTEEPEKKEEAGKPKEAEKKEEEKPKEAEKKEEEKPKEAEKEEPKKEEAVKPQPQVAKKAAPKKQSPKTQKAAEAKPKQEEAPKKSFFSWF